VRCDDLPGSGEGFLAVDVPLLPIKRSEQSVPGLIGIRPALAPLDGGPEVVEELPSEERAQDVDVDEEIGAF
jgi:hypothetical protein